MKYYTYIMFFLFAATIFITYLYIPQNPYVCMMTNTLVSFVFGMFLTLINFTWKHTTK